MTSVRPEDRGQRAAACRGGSDAAVIETEPDNRARLRAQFPQRGGGLPAALRPELLARPAREPGWLALPSVTATSNCSRPACAVSGEQAAGPEHLIIGVRCHHDQPVPRRHQLIGRGEPQAGPACPGPPLRGRRPLAGDEPVLRSARVRDSRCRHAHRRHPGAERWPSPPPGPLPPSSLPSGSLPPSSSPPVSPRPSSARSRSAWLCRTKTGRSAKRCASAASRHSGPAPARGRRA